MTQILGYILIGPDASHHINSDNDADARQKADALGGGTLYRQTGYVDGAGVHILDSQEVRS